MNVDFSVHAMPTPDAAEALGLSQTTIKRWAHPSEAIFREGEHWKRRRPHANSVKLFDLPLCISTMQGLGYHIPEQTLALLANANPAVTPVPN